MHLALQKAETINRRVEQSELLLQMFYLEYEKDVRGWERSSRGAN